MGENMAEQMPQTIGRYQVQGSIGFGAMGAVYKAFDPLIKRTLAIKTIRLDIPRQSPQYKSFIERFYHEARISGTLSHPNIVTLFDIGEEQGVPYLAMEFVAGETIASLLERGTRFKPEIVIGIVSQVATAIDYAHGKGVIHRDIKPANLMLYEGDRVKVTDFGIAKLMDTEMTQSGTLLGTPSYMSPEQAMGDKLDGRSDIFSLGVCAFEMMCGEQPFPGSNVTSILYKLVHVDPIEPTNLEMNGLLPQRWHEVFGRVLAKRPDERYQTATAFVQELELCLGSWFGALEGERTLITEPPALQAAASAAGATPAVEDTPATVVLEAPAAAEGDAATAVIEATPTARPAAAAAPAASPAPDEVPETVVMIAPRAADTGSGEPVPTLRMAAPDPVAVANAGGATAPLERRAAPRAATPAASARKSGVPVGLLLGGAAGLFVFALVTVALVLWQRGRTQDVAVATGPSAEATPQPSPSPVPALDVGALRVESQPAGAVVYVDGEQRGQTPLELPELPFGSYEIRLEARGYEAHAQSVSLSSDEPRATIDVPLSRPAPTTGLADILSTPFGADVTIDGAPAGVTPLTDLRLRAGERRVEIAKDGYTTWSGTLSVQAGRRAPRIDVRLDAVARTEPPAPPTPEPVDTNRVYANAAGEVDTPARRIAGSSVSYPDAAPRLRSGESVSVEVSFVVSETGEVADARIVQSGGKVLDEAVLASVRKWKYQPALKRGVPVKVQVSSRQTYRRE